MLRSTLKALSNEVTPSDTLSWHAHARVRVPRTGHGECSPQVPITSLNEILGRA